MQRMLPDLINFNNGEITWPPNDFLRNEKCLHPGAQPRLQSWGSVPWSRVLLPFYRKKLDRSTQFDAVGYIITLCSSKSYVKSWGSVQILGRSGPPDRPPVVASMRMEVIEIQWRLWLLLLLLMMMMVMTSTGCTCGDWVWSNDNDDTTQSTWVYMSTRRCSQLTWCRRSTPWFDAFLVIIIIINN